MSARIAAFAGLSLGSQALVVIAAAACAFFAFGLLAVLVLTFRVCWIAATDTDRRRGVIGSEVRPRTGRTVERETRSSSPTPTDVVMAMYEAYEHRRALSPSPDLRTSRAAQSFRTRSLFARSALAAMRLAGRTAAAPATHQPLAEPPPCIQIEPVPVRHLRVVR